MVGSVKHTKRAPALTQFLADVRKAVRAIPRGQTRSYGTIAEVVGKPGAARAVVRALHALEGTPWWRVCRAGGRFAPQVEAEQTALLRQEGWQPVSARGPRTGRGGSTGRSGALSLRKPGDQEKELHKVTRR